MLTLGYAKLGQSIECITDSNLVHHYPVVTASSLLQEIKDDPEATPQEKSALTKLLLRSIQRQSYMSLYTYTPGDLVGLGQFGEGSSQGSIRLRHLAERIDIPVVDAGDHVFVNDDRDGTINSVRAWRSCNCIFYPAILAV